MNHSSATYTSCVILGKLLTCLCLTCKMDILIIMGEWAASEMAHNYPHLLVCTLLWNKSWATGQINFWMGRESVFQSGGVKLNMSDWVSYNHSFSPLYCNNLSIFYQTVSPMKGEGMSVLHGSCLAYIKRTEIVQRKECSLCFVFPNSERRH